MTGSGARSGSGFRQIRERTIHAGAIISLVEGEFETPDDTTMHREIVRHPGAVSVVPVDGDDVILVRQYRASVDKELLEIPAGKRDVAGEAPEHAAVREMGEEIGFTTSAPLVRLAAFYNSAGFSDEHSHVFLATDLEPVPLDRHGPEESHMTIERLPLDDVAVAIANGRIEDAKTVVGLLAALRHLGR